MTVETIKDALMALPKDERHTTAVSLNELDYDEWDREMARDFSSGGRGTAWAERVEREIAEGKALPLSEGLAKANRERSGE